MLIKINEIDNKINGKILIKIISLPAEENKFNNFIPINQFISGSINLSESKTIYYFINHEKNEEDTFVVEFSKNYEGINYECNENFCTKKMSEVIEKYIVKNNLQITFGININNSSISKDLLNGYYMFRYYYLSDRYIDVNYEFRKIFNIIEYESYNENSTSILFEFENLIINNNTKNKYIQYKIYCFLFSDIERTELLNTTTITTSKPLQQYILFSSNYESNFTLNITFNETNSNNYKYIMQIKFYLDNYAVNHDMLAYTIKMDLTNILKKEAKDKEKDTIKYLYIALFISIILIIILFIAIIVYYYKMNKKNKELKDKVLSISFAERII